MSFTYLLHLIDILAYLTSGNETLLKEYLSDIEQVVWEPTRSGRTLTDAEMRLQMNFLTKLIDGSVADVEKNANRTGFADMYAEVRMPEWLENSFKERLGIFIPRQFMGCSHNAAAVLASVKEVRGFDDDVRLSAPMEPMEHVYYSELKKIRSLISSAVSTGSADTQRHYRLLLYKIDQALK